MRRREVPFIIVTESEEVTEEGDLAITVHGELGGIPIGKVDLILRGEVTREQIDSLVVEGVAISIQQSAIELNGMRSGKSIGVKEVARPYDPSLAN